MSGRPEWAEVESPFLDQLASMGWEIVMGSVDFPSVTGRESFREVFMGQELREAVKKVNLKDGGPWVDDARASQAVSSLPELSKSIGRKVQRLIDEHVISLGIDPRIPPIAITDAKFSDHLGREVSDRAKASEMEHAVRSHIKKKLDEDPVHYQQLSERLEEILEKFGDDWEQLVIALAAFIDEAQQGRKKDEGDGLDPVLHAPFFDVLKQAREVEAPVRGADVKWLATVTVRMVEEVVRPAVRLAGFWKNASRQDELRGQLFEILDAESVVDFDRVDTLSDQLMELAKANDTKLARES